MAEYLKCSQRQVFRLIERGLPFHRRGKRLLFHTVEVDEWLRAG